MTKQQSERLQELKREISGPKSKLIQLLHKVEAISPAQGAKLGAIIGRLEDWQNR